MREVLPAAMVSTCVIGGVFMSTVGSIMAVTGCGAVSALPRAFRPNKPPIPLALDTPMPSNDPMVDDAFDLAKALVAALT